MTLPAVRIQGLPFTFFLLLMVQSLCLSPVVSVSIPGYLFIKFLRWDGAIFPLGSFSKMNLLGLNYFIFPLLKMNPCPSLYNIITMKKFPIIGVQIYSRKIPD